MNSSRPLSDADLWKGLCRGEASALEGVYGRYGGLVYSVCLRVLSEPQLAEDATQEVFLNLWRRRDGWDPELGRLNAWLATAARNRSIDIIRRRRTRAGHESSVPVDDVATGVADDPWEILSRELESDAVREAVSRLPAAQQQVIELAYWRGYTHTDISGILNLPLGTVKGRMRLALEKLQSFLDARRVQP